MDYMPLIDTKKLGQPQKKCSCWWFVGWVVITASLSVAIYLGLVMRGFL